MNNDFVTKFLNDLALGNGSIINIQNAKVINDMALELYSKPILNAEEQDTLKKIIMICNIIYNRTDSETPFVTDGVYDLILEKYKTYDSNFQVGSMVVDFKSQVENDPNNRRGIAVQPISFRPKHEAKNEVSQQIFDQLTYYRYPSKEELFMKAEPPHQIEISKRKHDTEHNHPSLVGTLDKAKFVLNQDAIDAGVFDDPNVKVLERDFFQDHIYKGIINPNQEIEIVCELKYDGISIEADCLDEVISARTRGDTGLGQAADMTPILKGYKFPNAEFLKDSGYDPIGVKFEAIITKYDLQRFNEMKGKEYKNGRTAIVGLFGGSDSYLYRDLITLVPLAVDIDSVPHDIIHDRMDEIKTMEIFSKGNYNLRYAYFKGNLNEVLYFIKCFHDEAMIARDYIDFMYDGIVVSYVDPIIRNKLGRKNYINKYSMAVKFDPIEKQTIFRGYSYTVGQNGQVTPMIHYDPVEFLGTIHTKSTGSSYERFTNLALKYGDIISVKYVNDVMPYVSRVDCKHNRENPNPVMQFVTHCPICGSELVTSDSGKTMMCPNIDCPARSIQRMSNMMKKLNLKGFAEATFKAIPEIDHLYKMIEVYRTNPDFFVERLGDADGHYMIDAIQSLIRDPWNDYIIIGALGFAGIARKKWQSILEKISIKDLYNCYLTSTNPNEFMGKLIQFVPNIGPITAQTIVNEFDFFKEDIAFISSMNLINSYGSSNDDKIQIRFTGVRNLQLSELLSNRGFDADSNGAVTKRTNILIIPYEGFQSNKTSKVSDTCIIVPIDEFIANMESILSKVKR